MGRELTRVKIALRSPGVPALQTGLRHVAHGLAGCRAVEDRQHRDSEDLRDLGGLLPS
jgi:hypothetical protein